MTKRSLLLMLLEQAGERGLTTAELLQGGVGSRYGARLMELRAEGYVIEAVRLREGSWRYTLLPTPTPASTQGGAAPAKEPAPLSRLFESSTQPTTRSALTGEWLDGDAA